MKKMLLVMLAMVVLGGCAPKAYWKKGTSYKEAKEDVDRCYAKTVDAWKDGIISWDSQSKQYLDECMRKKGYVLRTKEEAYPDHYGYYNHPTKLKGLGDDQNKSSKFDDNKSQAQSEVLVFDHGGYYHDPSSQCARGKAYYTGYLTSIEDAKNKGYKPCPACIK